MNSCDTIIHKEQGFTIYVRVNACPVFLSNILFFLWPLSFPRTCEIHLTSDLLVFNFCRPYQVRYCLRHTGMMLPGVLPQPLSCVLIDRDVHPDFWHTGFLLHTHDLHAKCAFLVLFVLLLAYASRSPLVVPSNEAACPSAEEPDVSVASALQDSHISSSGIFGRREGPFRSIL